MYASDDNKEELLLMDGNFCLKTNRRRRRMHQLRESRTDGVYFKLYKILRKCPDKFREYYRINVTNFDYLSAIRMFHPDRASKQSAKPLWHLPIVVYTVLDSWWWTENLSETCRVLLQNKFEKLVELIGFIIRIYHETRYSEWQIHMLYMHTSFISACAYNLCNRLCACYQSVYCPTQYTLPWRSYLYCQVLRQVLSDCVARSAGSQQARCAS
jgi:hypothetical protein